MRPGLASRAWKWVSRTGLALLLSATLGGLGTYYYFDRDLPSVEELRHYQPPQVTKLYCAGGALCAEFYRERRTWVTLESLPRHVRDAFLAAEDAGFYRHEGLDFLGIVRAGLKGLLPGRRATGASTISQQACRNLLLTQERSLSRKIREWILTPRMEKAFSKDQILTLYLNAIYFGHSRYGVEEAALFYFGRRAGELSLGEAAALAGVLPAPDRLNPVTNMVKAKERQQYVLGQLWRHGFVPREQAEAELAKPLALGPRPGPAVGAFYAEEIRRTLISRYGEKAVHEGGLRVEVAMEVRLQAAADQAVREGLEALDRRQGYRGPLGTIEPARFAALVPLIQRRISEAGKRKQDEVLVADLRALAQASTPPAAAPEEEGAEKQPPASEEEEGPLPSADERLASSVVLRPLREGLRVAGLVTQVDDARKLATVDLISRQAQVSFSSLSWARPRTEGKLGPWPSKLSEVMRPGELVLLRIGKLSTPLLEASLDQLPSVQGALVVIEPGTRRVVAMVGGYDFTLSSFNRATQARRQPGSSFKPFLYGAALESGRFTPLSRVNDAPEAIRDPYTGKLWKPRNFEKEGFEGPLTLRQALTRSKNTVSVRLIEALTPALPIDFAARAGIRSTLPQNFTLALGTGEVGVLELANAYATLHSLGQHAEPIQILRVTDPKGVVLEEHQAAFEQTLPPPVAYLASSLMKSVVEEGTATQVKALNRPAAGKTGTAQEFRDAWFSGYTADYVATAWVGFDNHDPLGPGETGGRAALPIWLSFMKAAHQELPVRDFETPSGVSLVRIDPATGLLAGQSVPGRLEPFLEGTEPTALAPSPGQVQPEDFQLLQR